MRPHIASGALVDVAPAAGDDVAVGDIVCAQVRGRVYLHFVVARDGKGRIQIANARGHVNGWVHPSKVTGRVTHVDGQPRARRGGP